MTLLHGIYNLQQHYGDDIGWYGA